MHNRNIHTLHELNLFKRALTDRSISWIPLVNDVRHHRAHIITRIHNKSSNNNTNSIGQAKRGFTEVLVMTIAHTFNSTKRHTNLEHLLYIATGRFSWSKTLVTPYLYWIRSRLMWRERLVTFFREQKMDNFSPSKFETDWMMIVFYFWLFIWERFSLSC